jgi:hypothetical protein
MHKCLQLQVTHVHVRLQAGCDCSQAVSHRFSAIAWLHVLPNLPIGCCRDPTDIKVYRWDGKQAPGSEPVESMEYMTDRLDLKMQDRDHYPLRLVATELTTHSMMEFPKDADLLYAVSTNHMIATLRACTILHCIARGA